MGFEVLGQRCNQQGAGGQALLAIDHQQSLFGRDGGQAAFYINDGANEMGIDFVIASGPYQVCPQLAALRFCPRVVALIDRNDKLRGLARKNLSKLASVAFRFPSKVLKYLFSAGPTGL